MPNLVNIKGKSYQEIKEQLIEDRKKELEPLIGKTVRVQDSRTTIVAKLWYDDETQKYFAAINLSKEGECGIVAFYPLEIETVVNNIIRLCEI